MARPNYSMFKLLRNINCTFPQSASGSSKTSGRGNSVAIIDPTFGIKLSMNVIMAKTNARSTPMIARAKPTNAPTHKLINVFKTI